MKKCEKCGKNFECTGDQHCWCFEYGVSTETLEALRRAYEDCVCQSCLKEMARQASVKNVP